MTKPINPTEAPPPTDATPELGAKPKDGTAEAVAQNTAELLREAKNKTAQEQLSELNKDVVTSYIDRLKTAGDAAGLDWKNTKNYAVKVAEGILNNTPANLPAEYNGFRAVWMSDWIDAFVHALHEDNGGVGLGIGGDLDERDINSCRDAATRSVGEFDTWFKAKHPTEAKKSDDLVKEKADADTKAAEEAKEEAKKALDAQKSMTQFEADSKSAKEALTARATELGSKYAKLTVILASVQAAKEAVVQAKNPTELKTAEDALKQIETTDVYGKTVELGATISAFGPRLQIIRDKLKFPTFGGGTLSGLERNFGNISDDAAIERVQKEAAALETRIKTAERLKELAEKSPEGLNETQLAKIRETLSQDNPDEQSLLAVEGEVKGADDAKEQEINAVVDTANATMADKLLAQANKMEEGSMKSLLMSVLDFMKSIGGMIAGMSFFPKAQEMAQNFYTTQELIDSGDQSVLLKRETMKTLMRKFNLPVGLAKVISNPASKVSDVTKALDNADWRKANDPNGENKIGLDSLAEQLKKLGNDTPATKDAAFISVLGSKDGKAALKQAPKPAETPPAPAEDKPVVPPADAAKAADKPGEGTPPAPPVVEGAKPAGAAAAAVVVGAAGAPAAATPKTEPKTEAPEVVVTPPSGVAAKVASS